MPQVSLTKSQQLRLCEQHKKHPTLHCVELAAWCQETFRLPAPPGKITVSRILRQKAVLRRIEIDYRGDLCRMRAPHMRLLERHLVEFLTLFEGGCCKHFLVRHGFRVRRAHGEVHSVDAKAARDGADELRMKIAKTAAAVLPVLLGKDDLRAIETGDAIQWLGDAWNAMPKKVLALLETHRTALW
ncbi:hypothetical protein PF002_g18588 [Phytophthora fragariae]|uniref:ARS-binding protein 1 N-terminal domain-containing protein n=2 Tax=Phytophthora fragariae TaxID=53985 RepID=A0A6A3EJK1_9STRA|nr:hypothetical protein PF009_g18515 [Phytophthora fragariae]KAE8996824.1 hypothetical protein PF011_g15752 [Phytophthora fragariae]KAE9095281.1 hypothetical protein PF007_g17437 [Phytophthora fragariae]KAE9211257.1 hypothetical protein PF002_g18588 [Phytophthora fragariae]KAE9297028.1 hypothetical protein PF001_g16592 [Phytophthora fragariae]